MNYTNRIKRSATFRKLRSRSGASIVISLIFFLVCVTICAIILNAANINMHLLSDMRENDQSYLTVSSAAELIKNNITGLQYEKITTSKITHDSERCPVVLGRQENEEITETDIQAIITDGVVITRNDNPVYSSTTQFNGTVVSDGATKGFEDIIDMLCTSLYINNSNAETTFKIETEQLDTVNVTMTLDTSYILTAVLKCGDINTMTLVFSPLIYSRPETSASNTINKRHNFTYEDSPGNWKAGQCNLTIEQKILHVKWTSCKITKGDETSETS